VGASNTCAKTAGNAVCLNRNIDIPKPRKHKFCQLTKNAPVCVGDPTPLWGESSNLSGLAKRDASNPRIVVTLLPADSHDVLEADEIWSFVHERWNKRWVWTLICRRTRQIVAFVIGDRSETTCRKLGDQIP
jgi:hypothetical protein